VDIRIFDEIQKRYDLTESLFKLLRKNTAVREEILWKREHFSDTDEALEFIRDLFIIDFFAAFERLLRDRLSASVVSQDDELSQRLSEIILRESEYIKIEYLLDILKNFTDPQRVGLIKQIKRYRDWIAHGRKPLSQSPAKPVDIYIVFEAIRLVAVLVDTQSVER